MTPAHMESTGCYYNHRNCELFTATGCDSGTKWGDAIWENNQWNLRGTVAGQDVSCRCKNENFTNETCQGINTIKVHTSTAATVSTEITYTGGDVMEYYCTGCNSGYYIETIYNYNDAPGNCKNSNNNVVCSCSIIPQGWYGTENCSWGTNNLTLSICPKTACPKPGQTTLAPGATDVTLCTYAPNTSPTPTQFCDAKGCFSLSESELIEWGLNNP